MSGEPKTNPNRFSAPPTRPAGSTCATIVMPHVPPNCEPASQFGGTWGITMVAQVEPAGRVGGALNLFGLVFGSPDIKDVVLYYFGAESDGNFLAKKKTTSVAALL